MKTVDTSDDAILKSLYFRNGYGLSGLSDVFGKYSYLLIDDSVRDNELTLVTDEMIKSNKALSYIIPLLNNISKFESLSLDSDRIIDEDAMNNLIYDYYITGKLPEFKN